MEAVRGPFPEEADLSSLRGRPRAASPGRRRRLSADLRSFISHRPHLSEFIRIARPDRGRPAFQRAGFLTLGLAVLLSLSVMLTTGGVFASADGVGGPAGGKAAAAPKPKPSPTPTPAPTPTP